MRTFIRAWAFLACFAIAASVLTPRSASAAREEASLDQGWKFIKEDVQTASQKAFDDASWKSVNLPHTWNAEDATGGVNQYYRGPGWYRRHLDISQEQVRRSVVLRFGAAGAAAQVFVNGKPAGSHKGAFGAFAFDITSMLTPGDNVIAVRVTNARDNDIAPLAGDFNIFGGLYRDAKLITLDSLQISPLDFASSGVYVKQSKVTDDSAELEITANLRNTRTSSAAAHVKVTIADASGATVASLTSTESVAAGQSRDVTSKISLAKPHLWNGKADPYLYTTTVEISDGEGPATDRVSVPTGLRYFKVDPNAGFILNGKPYDLHGVNRHQDFGKLGWAITQKEMQIDLDLIKELGCTMVRCAHYEHSPLFYDLCDQSGLVVWAELCQVNQLGTTESFANVSKQQLTELIKQNFNHPSICFWSLYNELNWSGGEKDLALIRSQNDLAHQLDPTRLTTAASNRQIQIPGHWIPDIIGLNVYYGWYADQVPPDWKSGLDRIVGFNPERAVGISEYGGGGSIQHHEYPPRRPPTVSRWHPEEYQSELHEQGWKEMDGRRFWTRLLWVFADFPIASRREGDTIGFNDKGLITFDRTVKKDAFYFYKANWSDDPFVYITSRRFTPRATDSAPLKVYSNCDSVEIKLNGQSLGSKSAGDHIFVWDNAKMKQGSNLIETTGMKNGKMVADRCEIVVDPGATTKPSAP